MALAFFSHQGHQVFHDPCPDLEEYLRAMSVSLLIIPVDRLPDHILSSGLELMEGLFTPLPTNSFGTAFMAVYLVPPPSPRSVPLGGLAAPPVISGGRSVAPGGVSAGSMLLPTRGIGVIVGASPFNMGGLGVPQGISVSNMGGLGCRPDPDEGISAPPRPHHGSPLPLLDPTHLPHQKQHYVPYYLSNLFFISQICFWDHKYVFHLGKVFYHLVQVILSLVASMFLTLHPNLSNFRTSSHVP